MATWTKIERLTEDGAVVVRDDDEAATVYYLLFSSLGCKGTNKSVIKSS